MNPLAIEDIWEMILEKEIDEPLKLRVPDTSTANKLKRAISKHKHTYLLENSAVTDIIGEFNLQYSIMATAGKGTLILSITRVEPQKHRPTYYVEVMK